MTETSKPDLSEYEEEAAPFDDVMRKLLEAKPASKGSPQLYRRGYEVTCLIQ